VFFVFLVALFLATLLLADVVFVPSLFFLGRREDGPFGPFVAPFGGSLPSGPIGPFVAPFRST
jgi:hypothetical protein